MPREPHIPLFLWIATAALVHLTGGEGAQRAANVLGERLDVQRFADSVRRHVHSSSRTVEISLFDAATDELPAQPEPATPEDAEPDEPATPSTDPSPLAPSKADARSTPPEHPTDAEPVKPPDAKQEQPRAEKPKEPEKKKEEPPAVPLPAVAVPNRIAVVQHVDDQNQKDNPNADFIGDVANHVREQTQARITAADQNDATPTPGTSHNGPSDEPGNAHVNEVAQSEDSPGEVGHAPNEEAAGAKAVASVERTESGSSRAIREVAPDAREGQKRGETHGDRHAAERQRAEAEREARAGSREQLEAPDMITSRDGSQRVAEAAEGRTARAAERAQQKRLPPRRGQANAMDFLGLGAAGATPAGINLNLTPGAAIAAVGRDQLGRERVQDGERRRSTHRGSWRTPGIEKWRAAIENYNSSVKPGNQTALNTARVPFATYLNQIHNRLHPIFADTFLASLDGLPADHPLNRADMRTNLEIVIDKDEGKIVKMGVTRSSGSTVFDVAALEAVQNSSPFGKPPPVIVSQDGNVYLHWEFYRDPYYACSTYHARPYLLKTSPAAAPPHLPPPSAPPFGPREQPLPRRGDLGMLDPVHEPDERSGTR